MVKFRIILRDNFRMHFLHYNSLAYNQICIPLFCTIRKPFMHLSLSQNVDSCVAIFISITFATKTQPV